MAPAAEDESTLVLSPQRNVTFAVNYEVSHFWPASPHVKQNQKLLEGSRVESVPESTDVNPIPGNNNSKPSATPVPEGTKISSVTAVTAMDKPPTPPFPKDQTVTTKPPETETSMTKPTGTAIATADKSITSSTRVVGKPKSVEFKTPAVMENNTKRRSARETKKRQAPVERTRVRYDMELVPAVKRNRAFLDKFPLWMTPSVKPEEKILALQMQQQAIIKQHQQKLQVLQKQQQRLVEQQTTKQQPLVDQKQTGKPPKVAQPQLLSQEHQQTVALPDSGSNSDVENVPYVNENTSPELVDDLDTVAPFAEDTSVIWVPKKRTDWEDSVLEMTAVCTSASMRRYVATSRKPNPTKPFHAPLSKEYIKDRVDIDDPLNGYQIRHRTGGWLQGFILWTNFTTWTHYFKWDSAHAMSGMRTLNSNASALVDSDGSLAAKLELQPRSGNPLEGGVVFEAIAELSLVGGIGCGEYLLRMALDSIRATRKYKFVVLQATDSSKTFYERFGFVRVGAICRYERRDKDAGKPTPIMGYRHWTHPNESDSSLQLHGGPSYMMCLTLPEDDPDEPIETPFLDEMMKLEVAEKPIIEQLGGSSTPYPKARRGSVDSASSTSSMEAQLAKAGLKKKPSKGRRGSSGSPRTVTATSLRHTFDAKIPPALPILGGSAVPNTPVRNVASASAAKPMDRKVVVNSSGVKRGANTNGNPSTKKRRLSAATIDGDGTNRKAPRERTKPQATPAKNGPGVKGRVGATSGVPPIAQAYQMPKLAQAPTSSKKPNSKRAAPRRNADQVAATGKKSASSPIPKPPSGSELSDPSRTGLMKQKVKSYPRDRVHFYNKVVRPKKGKKSENYFVLHYDEPKSTIRVIPMEARGVLSGKRAGRPRFQVVMSGFPRNAKTVACADYDIVKAFMVMKTPVVASEAWDVLDA